MKYPKEPTGEQCNDTARVEDYNGCPAYAMWYPQMGGYCGKAVVVITGFVRPGKNEEEDGTCFDLFVWHRGDFPFTDMDSSPASLHHCSPASFIDFGKSVLALQQERFMSADHMPDEYVPGTLKQPQPARSQTGYAVAYQSQFDPTSFAVLNGPSPNLQSMLDIAGGGSQTVIVKYGTDGSCEIVYRGNDKVTPPCWSKVK